MDPISVLLDAVIGGVVGSAAPNWDPTRKWGLALTVVASVLGLAGAAIFVKTVHDVSVTLGFLSLAFPFGATYLAGVAGDRQRAHALGAAIFAALVALFFGALFAAAWVVLDLLVIF